jgi:hypothetical protein
MRQRLKTGPVAAPNKAIGGLRRKLSQLEIRAEVIEPGQLGALIPELLSPRSRSSAAECAAAAIETVIRTHTDIARTDEDRQAIDTIAAEAHQIDAG